MNSAFTTISHEMFEYLLEKAQKWMSWWDTEVVQVAKFTNQYMWIKKLNTPEACKKLLLGSGDNDLAEAIQRYIIRVAFNSKIEYGAKKDGHYVVYILLLKCIDDVPAHYQVQDFARDVFELLVNTSEYCCEKLQA